MPSETVVHVIDDDAAVRDSLAFLLETAGFDVTQYESATLFLEHLPAAPRGGCIVTDVRMPGMTGLELVRELVARGSNLPIIVITGHGDVSLAVEAMRGGVLDFIEKPFSDETILAAVTKAIELSSGQRQIADERGAVLQRVAGLSSREREVLQGLLAGKANKVIALELGISPRTIEVYRANVMLKMRAASLSELVRMAILAETGP